MDHRVKAILIAATTAVVATAGAQPAHAQSGDKIWGKGTLSVSLATNACDVAEFYGYVNGGPYPNPTTATAFVSVGTKCKQARVRLEYIDTNYKRRLTPWSYASSANHLNGVSFSNGYRCSTIAAVQRNDGSWYTYYLNSGTPICEQ